MTTPAPAELVEKWKADGDAFYGEDFNRGRQAAAYKCADELAASLAAHGRVECQHDWAVGYGVPPYCNKCGEPQSRVTEEIDAGFCAWLQERNLLPDPAEDGSVDWADIVSALNDHEKALIAALEKTP